MIDISIISEDQDLLVINKPAGIVVNEAETVEGPTIQGWFKEKYLDKERLADDQSWQQLVPLDFTDEYGSPEEIFEQRQGLVHRIDKETSGVLLLAKNPGALVSLLSQFKKRQTKKRYQCLVHGQFKVDSATVNAPISRSSRNRHKFQTDIEGRSATTHYQVLRSFKGLKQQKVSSLQAQLGEDLDLTSYQQGFSLVVCWPKTGRTHQIRVHMVHLNHPLVADSLYGGRKRTALDQLWCPRHFLHADWIELTHPRTGQRVTYLAALPQDLEEVLGFMD
ncbi:MAG: hypothetical protein GF381_01695 [Candidatus Pacebacteria bacterium]|nr:hypothetical protein [Candidatus Paceibacterota bacterium]